MDSEFRGTALSVGNTQWHHSASEIFNWTGAQVVVIQTDVSEEEQVARVLEHIARALPPLRALSMQQVLSTMVCCSSIERFVKVMAPRLRSMAPAHSHSESTPGLFRSIFLGGCSFRFAWSRKYAAIMPFECFSQSTQIPRITSPQYQWDHGLQSGWQHP